MDADDVPFCSGRVVSFSNAGQEANLLSKNKSMYKKKPATQVNSLMHKLSRPVRNRIYIPQKVQEKVEITQEEALSLLLMNGINYERAMFMCGTQYERDEVHERYTRFAQRPYKKDKVL